MGTRGPQPRRTGLDDEPPHLDPRAALVVIRTIVAVLAALCRRRFWQVPASLVVVTLAATAARSAPLSGRMSIQCHSHAATVLAANAGRVAALAERGDAEAAESVDLKAGVRYAEQLHLPISFWLSVIDSVNGSINDQITMTLTQLPRIAASTGRVAVLLGAIAWLSPAPGHVTDRTPAATWLDSSCPAADHCFRVLVPWTLGLVGRSV